MLRFQLLLAAEMLLVASVADAREPINVIMPENPAMRAVQEQYGYADAVIAGDMVFLSGIVTGPRPGETSLEPAYERAFSQIGDILKRAGVGFDDVVDISSFHRDLQKEVAAMAVVKSRYIKGPPPAWTAVGTTGLLQAEAVTEIKITAYKPRKS